MAHTVAFISPKGGVGKSTTHCGFVSILSANLRRGRILAIDGDGEQPNSLLYLEGMIERGYLGNVDTAHGTDRATLAKVRELDTSHSYRTIDLPGYQNAEEVAGVLEHGDHNAHGVDYVVVGMEASQFDIESVVPWVRRVLEPLGIPYGILLCRVRPADLSGATDIQRQLDTMGVHTMRSWVREYAGLQHAQSARKPITAYGGRHNTARRAEDDLRAMTREVLRRVGSKVQIPTTGEDGSDHTP